MDCKITENYFKEKARMTENCRVSCGNCLLFDSVVSCLELELKEPKSAISIVQKWSDEHPVKTYRDDFREKFPNCEIEIENLEWCDFYANGKSRDDCERLACEDCWNQPFPETTKDKKKTRINTNRDKLQSLTNNELAEMIIKAKRCEFCALKETQCYCDEDCSSRIKEWLESEVE